LLFLFVIPAWDLFFPSPFWFVIPARDLFFPSPFWFVIPEGDLRLPLPLCLREYRTLDRIQPTAICPHLPHFGPCSVHKKVCGETLGFFQQALLTPLEHRT
jgi:hypothetical protein